MGGRQNRRGKPAQQRHQEQKEVQGLQSPRRVPPAVHALQPRPAPPEYYRIILDVESREAVIHRRVAEEVEDEENAARSLVPKLSWEFGNENKAARGLRKLEHKKDVTSPRCTRMASESLIPSGRIQSAI